MLARGPRREVEVALRRARGEVLWTQGWLEAAVAELETAVRVSGKTDAASLGPRALAANLRLFLGDPDGAAAESMGILDKGERAGDDFAVCLALQTLAVARDATGEVAEAVALARRAVDVASRTPDPRGGHLHPHVYLGLVLCDADCLEEAEAVLQEGRRRAEDRGTVAWLPLYHLVLGVRGILVGQLDDALTEVEAGLDLADEVGTRLHAPTLHGMAALIALERDDLPTAEARLADAGREFLAGAGAGWQARAAQGLRAAGPRWPLEWGMWIRARLLEARGEPVLALTALEESWALAAPLRFFLGYRLFAPDLVRLAVAHGRHALAAAVVEEVESGAGRARTGGARGVAGRCRGLLDRDPEAMVAAVEDYRRSSRPLELAGALEDAGRLLRELERPVESVPLLEEALAQYGSFGMTRSWGRTEALLRSAGVRHRRSGRRRPVSTGWESLTATELAVARLTAEGLTNRQVGERLFVSRRTVETHLAHVFRKLGLSTRSQLAAEAARRKQAPDSVI